MEELYFLSIQDVIDIHDAQIAIHGEMHRIRDEGLLDSAVVMPQFRVGGVYVHATPFAMSGAYMFHLIKNHPFVMAITNRSCNWVSVSWYEWDRNRFNNGTDGFLSSRYRCR